MTQKSPAKTAGTEEKAAQKAAATTTDASATRDSQARQRASQPTKIRIRAVGVDRRCRAGMCFDREGMVLDARSLTQGQHEMLASDDYLKIEVAPDAVEASDEDE